ncbi:MULTISPECIES: alkaline phosphatase family protein [unclassified Pseudonocardia]|jgi:acid phosphatase|uniref:alkaline phosphatase family protein n=1 Tax=unclassified Pseudonocardia TaxID=2619320 RepID=UPI0009641CEE|nr:MULTISPECIES: alkaline phosphatase family protein [unclassified Pseudonocardia]MBN9102787.1 acid phosphatase [Pseudonocardia sp.]OJY47156.1 MAG: acid phosphatase [Pseudonocardia sp. 73-21]
MNRLLPALGAVLLTAVAACSTVTATPDPDATGPTVTSVPGALPRPDHVMLVVFENEDSTAVFGASTAPYLNSLAASGAAFTDAHGVAHPSQPNYVALFSGGTQGVSSDACPQALSGPDLASELVATGHTFTGYSEDLPRAGYTGCTAGSYARKHNPWADFADVPATANQPLSALPQDYGALPTVSIVVPNLCDDMHSCPIATGDAWARQHLAPYVTWAATHNSLLVVTFDEDGGTAANRIPTMVVGPMVRPGTSTQTIDHYDVLRTLEDMYGLPALGSTDTARPLTGIWTLAAG